MRRAELNHDIPSSCFPPPGKVELSYTKAPGISNQSEVAVKAEKEISPISPFRGDDIDDDEFLASIGRHINTFDDVNIDTYEDIEQPAASVVPKTDLTQSSSCLPNGKWSCLHKCKDKTSEGLDRPPKLNRCQSSAGMHQDRPVSKRAKVEAPLAQPLQPLKKVRFGKKDIDLIDLTKTTSDDSLEEELWGCNATTSKGKLSNITLREEPLNVKVDAREGAPIATERAEEETSEPFSSSFGSPSLNTSLTTLPSSSTLKTEKFQSRDMTAKETGCQRTTDYDNQLAVPQSFPQQSDKEHQSPFQGQMLPEVREQPYKDTPLTPDLPTKPKQLPVEWQGLDPELYEEFGDLVELI
ncbi:hypothetical protein KEM55_004777 [Ascosphaera atra]|nr:hypothetical protein KEM55_004777 [Ascosphaera atra]